MSGRHPELGGSHYGLVDMTGDTGRLSSYSEASRSASLLSLASTPVLSSPVSSSTSSWLLFATLCFLLSAMVAVMMCARTGVKKLTHAVWSQSSEYVSLP